MKAAVVNVGLVLAVSGGAAASARHASLQKPPVLTPELQASLEKYVAQTKGAILKQYPGSLWDPATGRPDTGNRTRGRAAQAIDCDPTPGGDLFNARVQFVLTVFAPYLALTNSFWDLMEPLDFATLDAISAGVFSRDNVFIIPGAYPRLVGKPDSNQYWTAVLAPMNMGWSSFDLTNARDPAFEVIGPHTYAFGNTVDHWLLDFSFSVPITGANRVWFEECAVSPISMETRIPPVSYFQNALWLVGYSRYQGVFDMCMYHEAYCTGSLKQYASLDHCIAYIDSLPTRSTQCGAEAPGYGDSKTCRFFRKFAVPFYLDSCYDLGPAYRPNGELNTPPGEDSRRCVDSIDCANTPLEDFVSDYTVITEGPPSAEWLAYLENYEATMGRKFDLDAAVTGRFSAYKFPQSALPADRPVAMARKDPHLYFPHGGRADFRGARNATFAMLSGKDVAFNVLIEEADFNWAKRLVHGTKIAAAFWVVRTSTGRLLKMELNATSLAAIVHEEGARDVNMKHDVLPAMVVDNVQIAFDPKTLSVTIADKWHLTATITAFPFGNRAANKNKRLLDISINALYDADHDVVAPHGILGQAYDADDMGVSGKVDTDHEPESTTSAQAEGAIEGSWLDYKLASPFATDFKYSRFDATSAKPRDVSKLTGKKWKAGKGVVGATDLPAVE